MNMPKIDLIKFSLEGDKEKALDFEGHFKFPYSEIGLSFIRIQLKD